MPSLRLPMRPIAHWSRLSSDADATTFERDSVRSAVDVSVFAEASSSDAAEETSVNDLANCAFRTRRRVSCMSAFRRSAARCSDVCCSCCRGLHLQSVGTEGFERIGHAPDFVRARQQVRPFPGRRLPCAACCVQEQPSRRPILRSTYSQPIRPASSNAASAVPCNT